ncbi:MAG: aldo/keto reductase family protein [Gammaproteobacteria bacterium]
MPGIIYGTAWKKERTAAVVEQAINQGFRGIDTACQPKHYFEAGVGEALARCFDSGSVTREQFYLQSKFTPLSGQDPLQIPYDPKAGIAEQVAESFRVSLKNLRTDYLDGLILHSPVPELTEAWQAMEAIVQSGGARQLGISNCYDLDVFRFLFDSATIKPAVLQNRFYSETGYDQSLREFCRDRGVVYQSFWTLTANTAILASPVIRNLALEYQRSPEQIFFRYLSQNGVLPLTGTTSIQHMQEDLAIFEFELKEHHCVEIDALF